MIYHIYTCLDAASLLKYVIHNFYFYHSLSGLAYRGPAELKTLFSGRFGVVLSWFTISGTLGAFNMLQPAVHNFDSYCCLLVWRLMASRGPNEPK